MFNYSGNAVTEFAGRQRYAERLREAEQDRVVRLAENGRRPRFGRILETARATIASFRKPVFRPSPGLAG